MGNKEKKFRGLDIATLCYFCGKDSWKINPEGHLPKITDKIEKLVGEFDGIVKNITDNKIKDNDAQEKAQAINKKILELALLPKGVGNPKGFDFDAAVQEYGWRTIDGIVIDMKLFLVDYGGVEEYRLSKQRLKETKESGFRTLEA